MMDTAEDSYQHMPTTPISLSNEEDGTSLSMYDDLPTITVNDSHHKMQKTREEDSEGEGDHVVEESPSPPSTSTSGSTLTLQSPIISAQSSSEVKPKFGIFDQPSRLQVELGRLRHHSASDRFCQPQFTKITPDTSRLCASEEELDQLGPTLGFHSRNKMKYLEVEGGPGRSRKRSASTDAAMYSSNTSSSGSSSLMKRLFQRLRSHSQGDIALPDTFKVYSASASASVSGSKEDVDSDRANSYEDITPSAVNTGLISKIKRTFGRHPRNKELSSPTPSSGRNSDFYLNDASMPLDSSWEALSFYDEGENNVEIPEVHGQQWPPGYSQESKPKKRGLFERNFVSRFKERHLQHKKRDRSGSLPNFLEDVAVRQQRFSVIDEDGGSSERNGNHKPVTRKRSKTLSDKDDIVDKTVYLGEFSVDDYFGTIESLSLEHLPDPEYPKENNSMKYNLSKYSLENIFAPSRGKSRSVDYAFQRTFDLENLKRKLGERTTSEPSSSEGPDHSEVGGGIRGDLASSDKKGSPKTILSGPVISYTVQANDTLMSIAARFDTTPSELTKMNRLSTRFLFPGQILTVPDKGGAKENLGELIKDDSDPMKESQSSPPLTDLAPPKLPGGQLPRTPANSVDVDRSLDKECLEKFLKIQVRHITDGQGVVAGVLLVTPNAVMFDPNVSDPLVIERGPESYGVIAPMEFVVNAALYYDIAHMKVRDTGLPRPEIPKPEIYYGPSLNREASPDPRLEPVIERPVPASEDVGRLGGSEESPSKEGAFPELGTNDNDNDSSCSCGGDTRESSAFPKAFEHELLTPISSDNSPTGAPSTGEAHPSTPAPPPDGGEGVVTVDVADTGVAPSAPTTTTLPTPAQSQCDTKSPREDPAQKTPLEVSSSLPLTNEKKRTTSVTFAPIAESDMPPVPEDEGAELPSQESRKQKVLKTFSHPLSWMESFGGEHKDSLGHSHQPISTSAPPGGGIWMGTAGGAHPGPMTGDMGDASRQGMFSNVFSMSNVSNMITRRASLDFVRRPHFQMGETQHPNSSSPIPPQGDSPMNPQQAQKRAQFKEGPKFGLKSMVSMDDMPDLFASFDKLIPKPASSYDESPLYLCLRMGAPIDKLIPKTTPIVTYGKKNMRPEYWFSIPKDRTDELYNFFQIWANEIYGELDEKTIRSRGFVLLDEEMEICPEELGMGLHDGGIDAAGELKEITKESWEVVSMSEELRKALYSSSSLTSLDIEVFLPEIQGTSEIIDDYIRKNMYRKLPARVQGHNWRLVFSTAQHGFSLKSVYRKMADLDGPILLFIQDTNQNKFGAFLSCPLRVSELFYGTGESFLFSCQPEFQVFPWTGENTFFFKGNNESLFVGGGDGNFGIVLDEDLYQGRSQRCQTFGNPVLSTSEDFIIKTVECWCFD